MGRSLVSIESIFICIGAIFSYIHSISLIVYISTEVEPKQEINVEPESEIFTEQLPCYQKKDPMSVLE
jgi:hypothetical protein